jgi:hypothetical protein
MNPDPAKGADQIVGIPTWLWVDANDLMPPPPVTVTAGGVSVTPSFSPQSITWDTGDGIQTCQGPGTPWAPGATPGPQTCAHTYSKSSAGRPGDVFKVTATVTWTVSYTVNGAPGGTLPAQTTTSLPALVRVAEGQAINN